MVEESAELAQFWTRLERATMRPETWNTLTISVDLDLRVEEFDGTFVA